MPNEVASIRTEMKLDRQQFAALFGVHRITVMRWERAEFNPSKAMLRWMRDELAKFRAANKQPRKARAA